MTNDLLLSTEGPMGYPIRPRGVITVHVAYTSVSRQAVPSTTKPCFHRNKEIFIHTRKPHIQVDNMG